MAQTSHWTFHGNTLSKSVRICHLFRHQFLPFYTTFSSHWSQHFDTSLNDLDFCSRSQLYEKSKSSMLIFSQISQFTCMKFSMLPQPVHLLKLMLNLFHMTTIYRRKLYVENFERSSFNTFRTVNKNLSFSPWRHQHPQTIKSHSRPVLSFWCYFCGSNCPKLIIRGFPSKGNNSWTDLHWDNMFRARKPC